MDFPFDVARVLPKQISLIDNTLINKDWDSSSRNREEYQQIYDIIDLVGEASSFAQGLNRIITTSDKLQNSDHLLYLLTEYDQNIGRTLVVGMLKFGRKKLFILDHSQKTHEVAPLCVLDFYIHESRQRRGYGRMLFDYMLKQQNVHPGHMALDKPSEKFLFFYKRHYNLTKQIPQTNNFAIFDDFFVDRPVIAQETAMTEIVKSNRSSRNVSPERKASANKSPPGRQQFAGKPSRQRDTNIPLHNHFNELNPHKMHLDEHYTSDILQGKAEGFIPSVRCMNKHQTSLDWMRSGHQSRDPGYGQSRQYSASRTPSYSGSPVCRTPRDITPPISHPGTPPRITSVRDSPRRLYTEGTASPAEVSVAPTPATSPHPRDAADQNGKDETDDTSTIVGQVETMSLVDQQTGKTGGWKDSISRSTDELVEHMSSKGATMSGVLKENESVHGHLKFHHHALW